MALTADQRVAIEALKTLARSRSKPNGLSISEAEDFASHYPSSLAADLLIFEATLADEQPVRSADTLISFARRSGTLIQLVAPTAVSKLTDELDAISDRKRIAEVSKALLYGGWGRGSSGLRSYLALTAMRDELAAGHVERARALLRLVKSPATLHEILIDNRLAAVRSDVEGLGGPHLEKAWSLFLTNARDDWLRRGDALSATSYVEALKQSNQYDLLASVFLARFMKGYNCPSDVVARSVGADLADSLARTGRWSKAEDVIRRSGGISPPIYAAMLLERGDFGRAHSLFERSLKAAETPKGKAEKRALAWLKAANACAATRSGRSVSTAPFDLSLLDVSARLFVLLCMDRRAEAQDALIAALANDDDRADALRWVQPFKEPSTQSGFRQEMNGKIRSLQRDPAVLESVSRYGVILDWPLTATVQQTTESQTPTANAWQCGDKSDLLAGMPEAESIHLPDSQP